MPTKKFGCTSRQLQKYQAVLRERYKIERKFGEAKQSHGLGRCRYTGWFLLLNPPFFHTLKNTSSIDEVTHIT